LVDDDAGELFEGLEHNGGDIHHGAVLIVGELELADDVLERNPFAFDCFVQSEPAVVLIR
jgi:hypothetical protein